MLNQNEKIYWKLYNDMKNSTYHGVIFNMSIALYWIFTYCTKGFGFLFAILFDSFVNYNMKSN